MKAFLQLNPVAELIYFIFAIGFSVVLMNPVCLIISLICAFISSITICGAKKAVKNLGYMLPMMIIAAIINPAFNHEGATIITYLWSGNPLTLESLAYGAAAGVMLASVICHFSCFNAVMTSDKLTYLFGRIAPALSLIFSMSLRFVPRFAEQFRRVSIAQRGIGRDINSPGLINKIKNAAAITSITISWALENSIETADSMKSRGYGLKGRSAFALYRFDTRDIIMLLYLVICGGFVIYAMASGILYWRYFPTIQGSDTGAVQIIAYSVYTMLMLTPAVMNAYGDFLYKIRIGGINERI